MDFLTVVAKLSAAFLPGVNFVFALMGLGGLAIGLKVFYDAYQHAAGEMRPNMISKGAILPALVLAGALAVIPVVMWQAAGTFVLGGNKTYDMFAHLQTAPSGGYCDSATDALTKLFMLLGTVSMALAADHVWGRISGNTHARNHATGKAWAYGIGGLLLFFVNDVAAIAAATTGWTIGLPQLCAALSAS